MQEGTLKYLLFNLEVGQSVDLTDGKWKDSTIRFQASIFRASHNRRYKVEPIEGGMRVIRHS